LDRFRSVFDEVSVRTNELLIGSVWFGFWCFLKMKPNQTRYFDRFAAFFSDAFSPIIFFLDIFPSIIFFQSHIILDVINHTSYIKEKTVRWVLRWDECCVAVVSEAESVVLRLWVNSKSIFSKLGFKRNARWKYY
jgi:hypothetical protein